MKDSYITAVLQEMQTGAEPEIVLAGLQKTLQKRGHTSLYATILRGVVRVLEAHNTEDTIVTVANDTAYEMQKAAIESALKELGAKAEPSIVVDESIIGGFVAEANNTRLDKSYKSKLVTLYRTLTK